MKKIISIASVLILSVFMSCNQTAEKESDQKESSEEDMKNEAIDLMEDMHKDHASNTETKGSAKSPRKSAMANIGGTHVHIDYSAPSKRGREIFGGLVAYDEVWVTGAHKATSIQFYKDVIINDTKVEKGKYALFTIPGKEEWAVILNKDFDQHLADNYDQSKDVLRLKTTPEKLNDPVEQLTFNVISEEGNKGKITMAWDKTRISIPVKEVD